MKTVILCAFMLAAGLGLGWMGSFMMLEGDYPSIVIEDHWHTVTTAPPPVYTPETPFHIDPAVVCPPPQIVYVPDTTTTTLPL